MLVVVGPGGCVLWAVMRGWGGERGCAEGGEGWRTHVEEEGAGRSFDAAETGKELEWYGMFWFVLFCSVQDGSLPFPSLSF